MDEEKYKRYWPADLHIIGKDILRFHTVYWPAFLMSAGLSIPESVFAHGMILTGEGKKMSKSLGNVIDPFEMAETYGVDPFRYFLLSNIPFGADGICGRQQITHRLNADLANNLGNLAQRSLTMIQKDWGGKVPAPPQEQPLESLEGEEKRLRILLPGPLNPGLLNIVRNHRDNLNLDIALDEIFDLVSTANRYFTEQEPWKLAKTDHEAQGKVLYITLEALRWTSILLQPFMPNDMKKLLDYLGVDKDKRDFASLFEHPLESGKKLPPPKPLFPKYRDE